MILLASVNADGLCWNLEVSRPDDPTARVALLTARDGTRCVAGVERRVPVRQGARPVLLRERCCTWRHAPYRTRTTATVNDALAFLRSLGMAPPDALVASLCAWTADLPT